MNLYLIFASILLVFPYLIPLWPARRLAAESRLLVSFFLYFRALEESIFLVPSYIVEYGLEGSEALDINLYYVVFTNIVIAGILCIAIKFGAIKSRKSNNHSLWQEEKALFKEKHILILAVIFLIAYIVLTDFVAITDPRMAYQAHRAGIGFVWAGFISLSTIWVVVRIVNRSAIMTTFIVYSVFCFLSGSKGLLFAAFLPFLANPRVSHAFRIRMIVALLPFSIVAFLILFGQFSANEALLHRLSVYFDMFHQSVRVFEDYLTNSFDFYFGKIYYSSLWQFVPRALYPEKPYAWGSTTLVELYYPGMAETGHTPSFGKFTTDFADFGYFGFLSAILNFEFVAKLFSLYIVSSNWRGNRKIYVISYAVLVAPGFYFHLPLFGAIFLGYFLLRYRRGAVGHRARMPLEVKFVQSESLTS